MSPTIFLDSFTEDMRATLDRHAQAGKRGWDKMTVDELLALAHVELHELAEAASVNELLPCPHRIREEAVDVANIMLFIYGVVRSVRDR